MTKLTQEDKDALRDLLGTPAWLATLKLADIACEKQEQSLLSTDTSNSKGLVIRKAKVDAAYEMRQMFRTLNQFLRKEEE